jgi:hypothetical protein
MSLAAKSRPSASRSRKRRADESTPQTGDRWVWRFRRRPLSLISRSRWMASWGIRRMGRSMRISSSRKPEIPVEPGVEQHPPVHVHAELLEAGVDAIRIGLDPQIRAVRVSTHDPKPAMGVGSIPAPPGDESAAPAYRPQTGLVGPRVALVEDATAGRGDQLGDPSDRVIGARGGIYVRTETFRDGEVDRRHGSILADRAGTGRRRVGPRTLSG